jgi:hypothetical protein
LEDVAATRIASVVLYFTVSPFGLSCPLALGMPQKPSTTRSDIQSISNLDKYVTTARGPSAYVG